MGNVGPGLQVIGEVASGAAAPGERVVDIADQHSRGPLGGRGDRRRHQAADQRMILLAVRRPVEEPDGLGAL
ncbi:MAG: hypothetical protein CFH10_01306, partial [Alphaproteobacteria bacterium MarineAlpha4_Bin2]